MQLFALATLAQLAYSQALFEPETGIYFGAWLDTAPVNGVPKDTPLQFNARLGRNASFFQLSQDIPLNFNVPLPIEQIERTNTDAFLMLTVYPQTRVGITGLTDTDIFELVKQIAGFTDKGIRVFLRLAPEMNGSWFPFGQQPTAFLAFWRKVYTAINANELAKGRVAMIWAPSIGLGYPYPNGAFSMNATSGPDFNLLDTNKDGVFDGKDDPYSPYYPGDNYVDWVGLSVYYFGPQFPWIDNRLPSPTHFADVMTGIDGHGNFYDTYCTRGGRKPFIVTESGASFHLSFLANASATLFPGPGELAIKQAYWRQYITNSTIQSQFPKLKAIGLFEYVKPEEDTLRDFQITFKTLDAFKADFLPMSSNYIFAKPSTKNSATGLSPIKLSGLIFGAALLYLNI